MDTPYIKIDEEIARANIARMQAIANQKGVQLRPHIKTHKSPEIANWQLDAGAVGVTVAKVSEAEVMIKQGITNLFIAYPIVTKTKIKRVLELNTKSELIVAVDSDIGAQLLSEMAREAGQTVTVRLEVDTGLRRTGVRLNRLSSVASSIHALPNLVLQGIFTFKGAIIEGKATLDTDGAGMEEAQLLAQYEAALLAEGMEIDIVSAGSSPTAVSVADAKTVDEIRPGTYVFNDAMQMKLGLCTEAQCAAKVVVTIVSAPEENMVVIDGGSKTFATDVQPNQSPLNLKGFGQVVGYPKAVFERMNEEHGVIVLQKNHGLKVGDQLEIIPNHICSTVNLHNRMFLKRTTDEGLSEVIVEARGCLQ
ncbi:metal-activated pyridoxal enzyme [Bacillus sp. JCM 19046]|nr:metal-activated pyridoxal enzyme [Bacillus sp. JCM 19045]GAF19929.1 metal-activated pyridoxal enzyme [Bacillus sp. JCM 19046]